MNKQTGVWIMFFHEAPGVPKRRTFAAVVFQGEAAYLACSTLSAKDQYNRRKGNDIALHRAARCFEAMSTGLLTRAQADRFLNRAGKYEAYCIAVIPESGAFDSKRSAALVLREALIRRHNFRPAPLKKKAPKLEEAMKEVNEMVQQAVFCFPTERTFGKKEAAPETL